MTRFKPPILFGAFKMNMTSEKPWWLSALHFKRLHNVCFPPIQFDVLDGNSLQDVYDYVKKRRRPINIIPRSKNFEPGSILSPA